MNALEANLLQRNIEGLGDAFERRAARKEQTRQFDLTRQDRSQQFAIEEELKRKQLEGTASIAAGKAQSDAQKITNRIWDDMVKLHGDWVKDGVMKPDIATKQLQAAVAKMPPEAQQLLGNNPNFLSVQSGEFSFQEPKGKEGSVPIKTGLKWAEELRAEAATNPAKAEQNNKFADLVESWATKQGQFAPQKQAVGYEETSKEFTNPDTDIKTTQRTRTPIPLSPYPATNTAPMQPAKQAKPLTPTEAVKSVAPKPPPLQTRRAGAIYDTNKGPMKWTGTGWVQP